MITQNNRSLDNSFKNFDLTINGDTWVCLTWEHLNRFNPNGTCRFNNYEIDFKSKVASKIEYTYRNIKLINGHNINLIESKKIKSVIQLK